MQSHTWERKEETTCYWPVPEQNWHTHSCQLNSEETHKCLTSPVLLGHAGQEQYVPSPILPVFNQPCNTTTEEQIWVRKMFQLCFDVIQQSTEENMQKYETSQTNTNHHIAICKFPIKHSIKYFHFCKTAFLISTGGYSDDFLYNTFTKHK